MVIQPRHGHSHRPCDCSLCLGSRVCPVETWGAGKSTQAAFLEVTQQR